MEQRRVKAVVRSGMLRGNRKRVKLNVYVPPNPDALSLHPSYTFISRTQGLTARSSQILSSQPLSVDTRVEEGPALDYGDYSLEVQDTDFEVEAGAANANKWDRTASVRIFDVFTCQVNHPSINQDNPLSQWMEDRDIYLQELL